MAREREPEVEERAVAHLVQQVLRREDAERVVARRLEPVERQRVTADPVAAGAAPEYDGAVADRLDPEPSQVVEPAVKRVGVEIWVGLGERRGPAGGVAQRVALWGGG